MFYDQRMLYEYIFFEFLPNLVLSTNFLITKFTSYYFLSSKRNFQKTWLCDLILYFIKNQKLQKQLKIREDLCKVLCYLLLLDTVQSKMFQTHWETSLFPFLRSSSIHLSTQLLVAQILKMLLKFSY